MYLAGEKGKKEWIAPNRMLLDPITGPVIRNLEKIRQSRYSINQEAMTATEIITTRYPAQFHTATPNSIQSYADTRDTELIEAINNMERQTALLTKATALVMENGVQFPIIPFKKQLDDISDLLNQTGMSGFKKSNS
jgi:hypothetical protein